MIIRIVKMNFRPELVSQFEAVFEERKAQIAGFEGCTKLQLLRGIGEMDNVFFTYSYWESEQALDNYRHSDFFKDTWSKTKALFASKAEAWSVEEQFLAVK